MRRILGTAIVMIAIMTVLTGLAYPLAITGMAQVAFHGQANGSLITGTKGQSVGSALIGQNFTDQHGTALRRYFQPRPSAAGTDGYDAMASGGANLGPTNPALLSAVRTAAVDYRLLNGLPRSASVPVDAVTTSGSGLDPEISIANARLQARRVASARHLDRAAVTTAIDENTQTRVAGLLGQPGVNVLKLNIAIDRLSAERRG